MSSRLFKHQVVAGRKLAPPKIQRLAFGNGDLYEVDIANAIFTHKVYLPQTFGANETLWSPDNKFIFFCPAQAGHTYKLYRDDGNNVWTSLTLPDFPGGSVYCADWSKDGKTLYVGTSSAPYLVIYRRQADNTFLRIPSYVYGPSATPYGMRVSPKGDYLVVSANGSPHLLLYKIATDGSTVMVTSVTPPGYAWLTILWLDDYTFTYLRDSGYSALAYRINPATDVLTAVNITGITTFAWGSDISPDRKYVLASEWGGTGLVHYKLTSVDAIGATLTQLTPPKRADNSTFGAQSIRGIEISPDGKMTVLCSTAANPGYAYYYRRDGDALININGPTGFTTTMPVYSAGFSN